MEKEFFDLNNKFVKRLRFKDFFIAKIHYCPHRSEDNRSCRKPMPSTVLKAVKDWDIDLKNSYLIGDRDDMDGQLARDLGINYRIIYPNAV